LEPSKENGDNKKNKTKQNKKQNKHRAAKQKAMRIPLRGHQKL